MPATQADAIKALIAESRLPEAVEALLGAWKNQDKTFYHFVLQIKERYYFLQNEIAKGVISQSDADLERARIADALIFLTDRLSNDNIRLPRHLRAYFSEEKTRNRSVLLLTIGIILLLSVIYFLFQFISKPTDFSLKITLQAPAGTQEQIAHQKAKLYFGENLFATQDIDSEGKIVVTDIPNKFLNDSIKLELVALPYKIVSQSAATAAQSNKGSIAAQLERVTQYTNWRGTVMDSKGNPIANASLNIESGLASDTTDINGNFQLQVPKASGERVQVMIQYQHKTYSHSFVLSEISPAQITVE